MKQFTTTLTQKNAETSFIDPKFVYHLALVSKFFLSNVVHD